MKIIITSLKLRTQTQYKSVGKSSPIRQVNSKENKGSEEVSYKEILQFPKYCTCVGILAIHVIY